MKNIIRYLLVSFFVFGIFSSSSYANNPYSEISLLINEELVSSPFQSEGAALVTSGRTIVPVRMVSERLGYDVSWNGKTEEVTIKKETDEIILKIGNPKAFVNKKEKSLPNSVAPVIINSRTYVPLRFVAEEFGLDIDYDVVLNQVSLNTQKKEVVETVKETNPSISNNLPKDMVMIHQEDERTIKIKKSPFLKSSSFKLSEPDRAVVDIDLALLSEDVKSKDSLLGEFLEYNSFYHEDEKKLRIVIRLKDSASRYDINNSSEWITITKKDSISKPSEEMKNEETRPSGDDPLDLFNGSKREKKLIVLDAGHGGKDSGAVNRSLNIHEKDIALIMSSKLREELTKRGYDVIETRTTDVFVELAERAAIANRSEADLLLSIHFNAHANTSAKGIETLYKDVLNNKEIAQTIQDELIKITKANNRGIVLRNNLAVLNRSEVPTVLLELGFLSNKDEVLLISDDSYQNILTKGVANAVDKILKN